MRHGFVFVAMAALVWGGVGEARPRSATISVTVSNASVSPSTIIPGGTVAITSTLLTNRSLSNLNLQYVIYDASGVVAGKDIARSMSLSANVPFSYSANIPLPMSAASGTYAVYVGVSTSDWATSYLWTSLGSLKVTALTAPTPTVSWLVPTPDITNFMGADNTTIQIDAHPFYTENANMPYSLTMVDSQTLRFELRSGDQWCDVNFCDTTMDNRAERTEVSSASVFTAGTTISVNYAFMMEPGVSNTASWFVVGQLHDLNVSDSPPFSIELDQTDHMRVGIAWLSSVPSSLKSYWNTSVNGQAASYGWAYTDPSQIQRGHAYAMQISIKLDKTNGFLKIVRDGQTIVNYQGPVGFGYSNYWKMGIYRAATTGDTQAAQYGNFTISP